MNNPHTTFLAPASATVNIINDFIMKVLFSNQTPMTTILNYQKEEMAIYRNMSVVITENR